MSLYHRGVIEVTNTARDEDDVPFGVQLVFIWLVIVIQLMWQNLRDAGTSLGDTDDAMRLVEVRALLNGRGWFDLHEPRVSPPQGYDTHWSRLVDGGLAGLDHLFRLVTTPDNAEYLTRMTWPLLWLGVTLTAIMATARRLGGSAGVFAAGFIAALSITAFYQFSPGRIDHHCVQIGLTMLVLAGITWSDRRPAAAVGAGVAAALAMAVGLESLPLLAVMAGALLIRWVADPAQYRSVFLFLVSFSPSLAAVYVGTVSPARLTLTACDALAWNTAVPLVAGGLLFALAVKFAPFGSLRRRAAIVILGGAILLAGTLALDPSCIHGPFAVVSPEARILWLDRVQENRPLLAYINDILFALAGVPLIIVSVFACVPLLDQATRRDSAVVTVFTAFALSILLAFASTKMVIYALWLVIPLLALTATKIWARFGIQSAVLRVASAAVLAPFAYIMLAAGLEWLISGNATADEERRMCNRPEDYRLLTQLPPGLVLTNIDSGPFVLANTEHSVWAAPYHRLAPQIVETIKIFEGSAESAEARIRSMGIDYVAVCQPDHKPASSPAEGHSNRSFSASLSDGTAPPWLSRVPGDEGSFVVYQVNRP